MRGFIRVALLSAAVIVPLGCQTTSESGGTTTTSLETTDGDTIAAVLAAVSSTSTSMDASQSALTDSAQTGRTANAACPEITFSASNASGVSLTVALDFGAGCSVDAIDLFCAGSATGALSTADGSFQLSFDGLSCDDRALDGSVNYTFEITESSVSTAGSWDLSYTDEGGTVEVTSAGNATHDRTAHATTFALVDGSVVADGKSYDFNWTNLTTSYFANGNFVPQAGQITVANENDRSLTIKFDANSPSTGNVLVSINGGAFFTYNLFDQE